MHESHDIIFLADHPRWRPLPAPPSERPSRRGGGPLAVLAVFSMFLVVGLVGLLMQVCVEHGIARLSPSERAAIVARTQRDLRETCALPTAHDGALRDHCVEEANFVLLFPECDAACGSTARAVLPRARK
jgi:hypothetical protein